MEPTDGHVGRPRPHRALGVVTALLLALTLVGTPPAAAQQPQVERVDGGAQAGDVRAIAVATCQQVVGLGGLAERVLIARDDAFADALAAAPLAGDTGCILYTGPGEQPLDPRVRDEVERVLPPGGQVVLLGGTQAVGQTVQDELVAAGYDVDRHAGPTRYETAAEIARAVRADAPAEGFVEVVLAYGEDWPDAVTAGAYAAAQRAPVVLTPTASLHPAADAFLRELPQVDRTTVVGGTAVIAEQTAQAAPAPTRFAGPNRMGTAATISQQLWPTAGATGVDFLLVNLERSDGWTAALTAAPLSALRGAPQLGVAADRLPAETAAVLDGVDTGGIARDPVLTVMGDQGFVTDAVAQQAADRLGGDQPAAAPCDPADGDAPAEIPDDATRVEQVMADMDGDGVEDRLTTYLIDSQGGTFFVFHVLTDDGYASRFLLDGDEVADVRPLGTAVIGQGRPTAFVVEQVGASTVNVAVLGLHDVDDGCQLARVTVPDDAADVRFPIGEGNGLQCRDVDGTASLVIRRATADSPDAQQFDWSEDAYTWPGAGALQFLDRFTGTFSSPEDDEQIQAFSRLDCPGVAQP